MWVSLPFIGNCPVVKDIIVGYNSYNLSGFLSSSLNSFNTKFGIELGPVAFLTLRETIILLIPFSILGLRKFLF